MDSRRFFSMEASDYEMSHNLRGSWSPSQRHRKHDLNSSPVDTKSLSPTMKPTSPYTSRIYDLLRSLSLQILAHIGAWRAPIEGRKIGIRKSYRMAALRSLLHLVPLGGAIALLILNWTQYFVGTHFSGATTLQFLAKFHELLMQTSIVELVICIIRTQAVNGFIPLGALSASMQAFQVSYLWSLDYVSAITSKAFYGWRKAAFVIAIPLLIFLTALVGPSSAILMIPRPGTPRELGSLVFYPNASQENMFPSHVNETRGLKLDIEYFKNDYRFSSEGSTSRIFTNTDNEFIQRFVRYSTTMRNGTVGSREPGPFWSSTATIPTRFIISGLSTHEIGSLGEVNASLSVDILRPVVIARCTKMKMGDKKTSSVPVPYVQDDGVSQAGLSSFRELVDNYVDRGGSNDTMIDSLPPFWATSPEPGSLSLIGSFSPYDAESCDQSNISSPPPVSEMFTEKYQNITDECLGLLTCTISAFWEASRDELVLIDGTYLVRAPLAVEASFGRPKYHSPITMTLDGIQAFNNPNFTNLFNRSIGASAPVEPLLAVVFATALSEVPLQENMEYAYSSQPTKNDFSKLEVKTTQYGYGYKSSLNSVRLSLVVMTIYCIITVGYILYLLVTGLTSTAWNSGIELVVLALQSRRPDHLGHTSVGIGSMKTYREGVGIRVNSLDEVELVFAHDRDSSTRGLRQVVPNKSY